MPLLLFRTMSCSENIHFTLSLPACSLICYTFDTPSSGPSSFGQYPQKKKKKPPLLYFFWTPRQRKNLSLVGFILHANGKSMLCVCDTEGERDQWIQTFLLHDVTLINDPPQVIFGVELGIHMSPSLFVSAILVWLFLYDVPKTADSEMPKFVSDVVRYIKACGITFLFTTSVPILNNCNRIERAWTFFSRGRCRADFQIA